ncbi:MAG: dihydrofolate reductase family protein [Actinomycetes bacterium]
MSANGAKTAHTSASTLNPEFTRLYDIKEAKFILNLIVDRAGGFAPPGASKELTNPRDRQLFHHLRAQCDLILIGAETARIEPYRDHKQQVAVMTRTGILPDDFYTGITPWIFTDSISLAHVKNCVDDRAEIFLLDSLSDLFGLTVSQGIHTVLCEGGGDLALQLASADLLDLIFLTRLPHHSESVSLDVALLTRGVPLLSEITEERATYQRHERILE